MQEMQVTPMSSGGVFSSGHSYHSYFNLLAEVKKQPFLLSLIFTNYHKPEKSLKGNSQKQENKLLKREKIYMYKYALLGQEFSTNMLKKKNKSPGISQASLSEELKIF